METLLELLTEMKRLGGREAVRFNNGFRTWELSYGQLTRRIAGFSRYLETQGLRKGDRLLLWGENRPEWIVVFWASLARGVEVVPVDFRSTAALVRRIQDEVGAKLLVHGGNAEREDLNIPRLSLGRLEEIGEAERLEPTTDVTPRDVVEILYTSGTTGEPRGVVHRHRNICANLSMFEREIAKYKKFARPFQPIRILDMLPLSHMFGQSLGIFFPVLLETSVVLLSELHPGVVMETIRRERISALVSVPRLLANLRREIEGKIDLPARKPTGEGLIAGLGRWLRYRKVHNALGWKFWAVVVGGARLPPEEEEFWWLMGLAVVQGYGLTETSPIVATNHPLRPRRGSIGSPIEGQEVRIAADGEILVRGESVVAEYLGRRPDESTAFRDGWLHTGDLGWTDENGRLYFRGRKKDVIVTSDGLNVYPQDVEGVLNRHPEIKEAVVLGLPSDKEERVHAVLILEDPRADAARLIREVNGELETHQRIRGFTLWPDPDFPRTPSTFKVKRREVRNRLLDIADSEPSKEHTKRSPNGVVSIVADISARKTDEVEDSLRIAEDLGLSSLDRVELLSRLEVAYGLELDEEKFAELQTVEDLKAYVHRTGRPAGEDDDQTEKKLEEERRKPSPATAPRVPRPGHMPRWPRSFPVPWFRYLVLHVGVFPLFRHFIDFSVDGLSNIDQVEPPVLLASNHTSHLDTVAILAGLPSRWRRRVAPAMRQEHFRGYLDPHGVAVGQRISKAAQYWLACGFLNAYPLPQKMAGVRRSLKFTGELIQEGFCPLVFPEGERSPDGKMRPFKAGIGLMAVRLRVPVVPIHLTGLFEILSIHDSWPRTGAVRMRVGGPLRFAEGKDYEEAAREIEEAVRRLDK